MYVWFSVAALNHHTYTWSSLHKKENWCLIFSCLRSELTLQVYKSDHVIFLHKWLHWLSIGPRRKTEIQKGTYKILHDLILPISPTLSLPVSISFSLPLSLPLVHWLVICFFKAYFRVFVHGLSSLPLCLFSSSFRLQLNIHLLLSQHLTELVNTYLCNIVIYLHWNQAWKYFQES